MLQCCDDVIVFPPNRPYVDVPPNTELPAGAEGVVNVAVNSSHSFSAWKLRNGMQQHCLFSLVVRVLLLSSATLAGAFVTIHADVRVLYC